MAELRSLEQQDVHRGREIPQRYWDDEDIIQFEKTRRRESCHVRK